MSQQPTKQQIIGQAIMDSREVWPDLTAAERADKLAALGGNGNGNGSGNHRSMSFLR